MKHPYLRRLSALLVIMLLLSAALAEEAAPDAEPTVVEAESAVVLAEEVTPDAEPDIVEAESADAPAEEAELELSGADEAEIVPDAPEVVVFEAAEIELSEDDDAPQYIYSGEELIAIDDTNFPDLALRYYLSNCIDNSPKDGKLSLEERSHVYSLHDQTLQDMTEAQLDELRILLGKDNFEFWISDVGGYQYFPNLEKFDAGIDHNLTVLDVSQNNKLTELYVGPTVKTLILGDQPHLDTLWADGCKITELDVSGCTRLLPYLSENYRRERSHDGYTYWEYHYNQDNDNGEIYRSLRVNKNVKLITKKAASDTATPDAPAVDTASSDTTVTSEAPPTPAISAVRKNGNASVSAIPGTVFRLELGGGTGKKFKSSRKKVATVDRSGNVTIRGAGKTKITFRVGKKKRAVTLRVTDPSVPTSVALNMTGTNAVKKGDSVTLVPTIPENTSSGFKWKSSNKKVATVKGGVVTFKKPGKVTITCTAKRGGKKAKVRFRVGK